MNRVHMVVFQHESPCLAGNFSTQRIASNPLYNRSNFIPIYTDSRVNEQAKVYKCLQRA